MQLVEIALFAAVAALALTLIGYAVRPYLRAKRRPTAGDALAEPPRAPRELAPRPQAHGLPGLPPRLRPGLAVLPPRRARSGSGQRSGGPGGRRRAPPARPASARTTPGKKFCAFDGEELVPLPLAIGAGDPAGAAAFAGGLGKICPNCSRRYESDATFCGRDGEELVPVN